MRLSNKVNGSELMTTSFIQIQNKILVVKQFQMFSQQHWKISEPSTDIRHWWYFPATFSRTTAL